MKNPQNTTSSIYFYAIGLSYKKANATIRGLFSLNKETKHKALLEAQSAGIESALIISTCNRTEIYGFAEHPFQLIKHICNNTKGNVEDFQKVAYVYKGKQAIEHLFRVGSGLDSQILGDFEIISQLKLSAKFSRSLNMLNGFMERLVNAVIQASKRIKTETELSTGATSVAFASVQYILNEVKAVSEKNILLFGTGKIGRNTCENLIKHTQNKHITLINRTKEKANKIAGKFNVLVKDFMQLETEISNTDVLIVATSAQEPTVKKAMIDTNKPLLILDLSIPRNVEKDIQNLDNITLVHLDNLSSITDKTMQSRKQHIPKAEAIIKDIMIEFNEWLSTRKFAPTIKALKNKLQHIKTLELEHQLKKDTTFNVKQAALVSDNLIQKITNHFAHHLKTTPNSATDSLSLIQDVFQLENTNE